jgi:serine/threonine-protein kinase
MLDHASQTARSRLSPGTRLNGIYEVDHLIASGGMGEVYKGHTIQTGDAVAIKVLLPDFAENDAALGLFRREASALHNLQHEAIVRYYVFTIEPALRRPYLAMEFVEGQSLSELVRREPLTYEAVRSLLKRVAAGLHVAHERGIVHRDVSSDNIMIPGGDVARAKIIDFGIARSTLIGDHTIIGGGFAGKYNYVSPEQLGLFGGDVRAKSDIYSLGLVLIEALTGQPVDMGGSQAAVLDKRRKVPDLGAIDLRIRPLLERMLQPDPAARPESMAQVAAWPLPTSRPGDRQDAGVNEGRPSRAPARNRGRRYALAGVLAVLMMGSAGVAYLYQQSGSPDAFAPSAPGATKSSPAAKEPKLAAPSDPPAASLTPSGQAAPPPVAKQPAGSESPPSLTPSAPTAPPPSTKPPSGFDTAALPAPAPGRTGQIERYIAQYKGGDCFFITPNTIGANVARIDGYGAEQSAFEVLDDAFKRANGFEADIDVRQVTTRQCPALTFLARVRSERGNAPRLQIGETNLKSGQALIGSIEGVGNDSVQLLLVSDEGLVQDLSPLLKPAGDARTFNLRMLRTGAPGAQPQLLLVVTSARPLETLRDAKSPADQLFPLASVEVTRTGQAVGAAVRYFKLDR